jgi:hypothetical protein
MQYTPDAASGEDTSAPKGRKPKAKVGTISQARSTPLSGNLWKLLEIGKESGHSIAGTSCLSTSTHAQPATYRMQ